MGRKEELQKVTVMLPKDLLELATAASGEGLTPTIRKGLEAMAAGAAYERLRQYRGQYKAGINVAELREDRD
jgi:hypothetical protein